MARRRGGLAALLIGLLAIDAGCGRSSGPLSRPPSQRATPVATRADAQACVILTDPGDRALVVNAGAQVAAPRCEVHVASRGHPAAVLNADSRLDVAALCVAGDIDRHGGLVTQPLQGCAAAIDPFITRPSRPLTAAPCDQRPHAVNGGTARLEPGVYCGGLAFNGAPHVTFAPGLYVVRGGDWIFNGGDYVGHEVSFYFADGSRPVFNSGVDVDLAAAVVGPHAGVLMDEAPGLAPSVLTFNDARRMNLEGVVHLPSRRTVFNSGSTLTGSALTAVFASASLNQTRWNIGFPAHRP